MDIERIYSCYIRIYLITRHNKRYGKDAMEFEANWVPLLYRLMYRHLDRTFRIDHNYAFLVSRPKWREIFATEFSGRLADHEICESLSSYIENILSPRTYNNRIGKGSQAAINQVIEDMNEVSLNYTRKSWVIKLDFKGYFPNALWEYAEKCICKIVDDNRGELEETRGRGYPEYLKWLVMVCVNANPARHCELRTPKRFWNAYIEPEKSIITKPEGTGAAIGRLLWQTAMGLYVNDEIKWFTDEGIKVVCFVDDLVLQVEDRYKDYALRHIPILRERLRKKNVTLNEKKFYCQPYWHGLEFLGSHIKPYRIHLNNTTYYSAISKITEFNKDTSKYSNLDHFVSSINSYTGLLKNRTEYKRLQNVRTLISKDWYRYTDWNDARLCITFKEKYDLKHRLDKKYHLHLKIKRNDKHRKKESSLHGEKQFAVQH